MLIPCYFSKYRSKNLKMESEEGLELFSREEPKIVMKPNRQIVVTTTEIETKSDDGQIIDQKTQKKIQILTDGEDGEIIDRYVDLVGCTELVVNFYRIDDKYIYWNKPSQDNWSLSVDEALKLYHSCDRCGLDCSEEKSESSNWCAELKHEDCNNCGEGMLLCSACSDTVVFETFECKWCIRNPFRVLLRKLRKLSEHKPTKEVVLKKVSVICRSFSHGYRNVGNSIIYAVNDLGTYPELFMTHFYPFRGYSLHLSKNISKMYLMTDYERKVSFANFFDLKKVSKSIMTDLAIVNYNPSFSECIFLGLDNVEELCQVIRPRDTISLAEEICVIPDDKLSTFTISDRTIDPEFAYALRHNRLLLKEYWKIWRLLKCCSMFPRRNPITVKRIAYRKTADFGIIKVPFSEEEPNYWRHVNRDVFNKIFQYISPSDWEITDSKKRKGKLTTKTAQWATNIISAHYRYTIRTGEADNLQSDINREKDQLKWYKKELERYQKLIEKHPETISGMEKELEEVRKKEKTFIPEFREVVKYELLIRDGLVKRQRTKKRERESQTTEGETSLKK